MRLNPGCANRPLKIINASSAGDTPKQKRTSATAAKEADRQTEKAAAPNQPSTTINFSESKSGCRKYTKWGTDLNRLGENRNRVLRHF